MEVKDKKEQKKRGPKPVDYQIYAMSVLATNLKFKVDEINRVIRYNKLDMKLKKEYIIFLRAFGLNPWQIKKAFKFTDKRNIQKITKEFDKSVENGQTKK